MTLLEMIGPVDVIDEILSITLGPLNLGNKYAIDFSAFNRKNGQMDAFLRSAAMLDFLQSALLKISKLDLQSEFSFSMYYP
jgi:hypothetical protein